MVLLTIVIPEIKMLMMVSSQQQQQQQQQQQRQAPPATDRNYTSEIQTNIQLQKKPQQMIRIFVVVNMVVVLVVVLPLIYC